MFKSFADCHIRASSVRCAALTLVMALLVLLPGAPARGQEIPLVPKPVTAREFLEYCEMLKLSDQQKLAALAAHSDLKAKYRQLEERDVDELLDEVMGIGLRAALGNFDLPPRDQVEDVITKYRRLLKKADGIDRAFFDRISGFLIEEQLQRVPRVRKVREMMLYNELMSMLVEEMNPGAIVNMLKIVSELDLSPGERRRIDPILESYESSRLRKLRDGLDILEDAVDYVLDAVDEMGIRTMDPQQLMRLAQDPQMIEQLKDRFNEVTKPVQRAAWDASQHNMQVYRQLRDLLEDKNRRELRDRYFRRGYRRVYDGPGEWRSRYGRAMRLPDISQDLFATIRAERDRFDRLDAAMVDRIVDKLEKSRKFVSAEVAMGEQPEPMREETREHWVERHELFERANAALDALLGPEMIAQLNDKTMREQGNIVEPGGRVIMAAGGARGSVSVTVDTGEPVDPFAQQKQAFNPYPMTAQQFAQMTDFLAMQTAQREVAGAVFDDYRQNHEALRDVAIGQVDRAEQDSSHNDQDAEELTPTQLARQARERFDALAALDDAMLEDINLLLSNDQQRRGLRWISTMRRRAVVRQLALQLSPAWGQQESQVDIIEVLIESVSGQGLSDQAAEVLDAYARDMTPPSDKMLEASTSTYRVSQVWARLQRDGGDNMQRVGEQIGQLWTRANSEMTQSRQKMRDINRKTLDELLAAMNEQQQWITRLAYNQRAYPDIYADTWSAERFIKAALNLSDLEESQRQRIDTIATDYREVYGDLCEQMVELRAQQSQVNQFMGVPDAAAIKREITLDRLRFDRNEAMNLAKLQLRFALDEAQIDAIPELRLIQ